MQVTLANGLQVKRIKIVCILLKISTGQLKNYKLLYYGQVKI